MTQEQLMNMITHQLNAKEQEQRQEESFTEQFKVDDTKAFAKEFRGTTSGSTSKAMAWLKRKKERSHNTEKVLFTEQSAVYFYSPRKGCISFWQENQIQIL